MPDQPVKCQCNWIQLLFEEIFKSCPFLSFSPTDKTVSHNIQCLCWTFVILSRAESTHWCLPSSVPGNKRCSAGGRLSGGGLFPGKRERELEGPLQCLQGGPWQAAGAQRPGEGGGAGSQEPVPGGGAVRMSELSGRAEIRAEKEKKGRKNIVELDNNKCYNYHRALSFFDLYLLVLSIFMNDEEKYCLHFVILHTSKDSFI